MFTIKAAIPEVIRYFKVGLGEKYIFANANKTFPKKSDRRDATLYAWVA